MHSSAFFNILGKFCKKSEFFLFQKFREMQRFPQNLENIEKWCINCNFSLFWGMFLKPSEFHSAVLPTRRLPRWTWSRKDTYRRYSSSLIFQNILQLFMQTHSPHPHTIIVKNLLDRQTLEKLIFYFWFSLP